MRVSVVTPWLEHLELREDYERALELGPAPDEVVVVDDGSEPPLEFASLRIKRSGFCRACNTGLKFSQGEIVVFLNNDIAATQEGWLYSLVDAVELGVLAGARLRYDAHGNVGGYRLPYLDGWCLAGTRQDLLALGGFDESLAEPAYYSDNLLCLEARARGMRLREVPLGLRHKVGATSGGPTRAVESAIAANYQRFARRARELLVAA